MRKRKDWFQNDSKKKPLGDEYEMKAVTDHPYFVKVKSKRLVDVVRDHFGTTRNLSCLDVGCGSGETCFWLGKYFSKVVGIDYSKGMIQTAKSKKLKRCTFQVVDSSRMPFKDRTFDVAVFFNVIHHIESKKKLFQAIKEAGRVVRKGGLVVVVDMNTYNPITRHVINTNEIDEAVALGGFKKNKFPTTLTMRQCKKVFSRCGVRPKYSEYLIFFPKFLSAFLPLERFLKKIPMGGLYILGGTPRHVRKGG